MKEALVGYFLAITAAEFITAIGEPVWGIFGILPLIAYYLNRLIRRRRGSAT